MARLKLRMVLLSVIVLIVVTTLFTSYYYNILERNLQNSKAKNYRCPVIQVGIVCITQSSKVNLYIMLKSLFASRSTHIHFHIVVNQDTRHSLSKLFDTWALPQIKVSFYNLNDIDPNGDFEDNPNVLRMVLPKLIKFQIINKIILLSTDIVFNEDILQLWNQFRNFNKNQILGMPFMKNTDERTNADVVLYELNHLRNYGWEKIWKMVEDRYVFEYSEFAQIQLIVSSFRKSKLEYVLPCSWNSRSADCSVEYKVIHQNLKEEILKELISSHMNRDGNVLRTHNYNCGLPPKVEKSKKPITDKCYYFPESEILQRRTLLYFYNYEYLSLAQDVTLVTQLSIDKLFLLEKLALRWNGPMSISLYVTDEEYVQCREFIKKSEILKNRLNIGYHAVFKVGNFYHINYLRNIALSEAITPYVFLNDIDLLPMENSYSALVVPAFETKKLEVPIPGTIKKLLKSLEEKKVIIVREDTRPEGQGPTNYGKWKTATKPYKVTWKNKYEPYVVVKKDVVKYDERFFAYGWDKISHIMEIVAQGYEFYVLPNVFIVHKFHERSRDKISFLKSEKYKMCLESIKVQSAKDLKKKYGRTFLIK